VGNLCYTARMVVGIDEVGRGCWAGPLVAGAVMLRRPIQGLRDSKKLTKKQRELLNTRIKKQAMAYGLGWVSVSEIDALGLTAAISLAMRRALQDIAVRCDEVIIDGSYNFLPDIAGTRCIVRADDTVPSVSAASIIAKVARDAYMASVAAGQYPMYGFEKHVGYGTALHRAALLAHGICDLHRRSFAPIKRLLAESL